MKQDSIIYVEKIKINLFGPTFSMVQIPLAGAFPRSIITCLQELVYGYTTGLFKSLFRVNQIMLN